MKNDIKYFVINLPESRDRKLNISRQLDNYGIIPTFIEAVNGKNLTKAEIDKNCDQNKAKKVFGRELFLGEIGCALSHKKIYENMIDEDIGYAVILEDDVVLYNEFSRIVQKILRTQVKWDLVLLGHHKDIYNEVDSTFSFWGGCQIDNKYSLKRLVGFGYGTYAYIVTNKGAVKLLAALKYIERPIDHYTADNLIINMYGLEPTLATVKLDFETLIDNMNSRKNVKENKIKIFFKYIHILDLIKSINNFRKQLMPVKKYY